jgi:hypothetical protein
MSWYLISFEAHAMDHLPGEDMPAVAKAAHAVSQEAVDAGVFVCAGALEDQRASIVTADGTVTDGRYPEAIGGFTIVDVPSREEALAWGAKLAAACRCAQEVRAVGPDPELDAMLRRIA